MTIHSKSLAGMALGLLVFLAACGSDTPTGINAGDQLSDAEIQAILNQWGEAIGDVGVSPSRMRAEEGIQLAQIDVDQNVSVSAPCQTGTIGVDGSVSGWVDDVTYESEFTLGVSMNFSACAVPAEDITVTLDPKNESGDDPDVAFEADFEMLQTSFSVSGTEVGGFSFEASDGRKGSCAIDLSFSVSYTEGQSASSSVSGEICGRSASAFQAYSVQ